MKYFRTSILFAIFILIAHGVFEYKTLGLPGALESTWIAVVLAILEFSLSFDNAVINAKYLDKMDAVWRHRFLTWGMAIAVFGMRFVFPIAIVAVLGSMNPIDALKMSFTEPRRYAEIILESHHVVAAFGGVFLLLVALEFFLDEHKDEDWVHWLEKPLRRFGSLESMGIVVALLVLLAVSNYLPEAHKIGYISAGICGILLFFLVNSLSSVLESGVDENGPDLKKVGLSVFLYLEVLDASFSVDGVVGAFAITPQLITILAGLSIGAFFVRSLTLFFVDKKTLKQFIFLEHGAFYAILVLALELLFSPFTHSPEWLIGLVSVVLIGMSLFSSYRHQPKELKQ